MPTKRSNDWPSRRMRKPAGGFSAQDISEAYQLQVMMELAEERRLSARLAIERDYRDSSATALVNVARNLRGSLQTVNLHRPNSP